MTRNLPRIGIFGGSFDPIHVGHLIVAGDAFEALALDRLVFVPTALSPFKQGREGGSGSVRCRMVEAAIAGDPRFSMSRIEVDRGGVSWTVDTLREVTRGDWGGARPEGVPAAPAEVCLLMGADQWGSFGAWREPLEVARLARIVVMARGGEDPSEIHPGVHVVPTVVPVTRVDLSSTAIRRRVREGRSIRHRVPEGVRRCIEAEGLYLEPGPGRISGLAGTGSPLKEDG